jgi:TPR repeat protein
LPLVKAVAMAAIATVLAVIVRLMFDKSVAMNAAVWIAALLALAYYVSGAERILRAAALAGHASAINSLGLRLRARRENAEAKIWFQRAAGLGHLQAMNNLGLLLRKERQYEEAEAWLRKAADLGSRQSVYNLGLLLLQMNRLEEAEPWLSAAAEKSGTVRALNNLGIFWQRRGRPEAAEPLYRQAVRRRTSVGEKFSAMNNLGLLLLEGGDVEEAKRWFARAAKAGSWPAMNNYGVVLLRLHQFEQAERWFRRSARAGNREAALNLGRLLIEQGNDYEGRQWLAFAKDPAPHGDLPVRKRKPGHRPKGKQTTFQGAQSGLQQAPYIWLPRRPWATLLADRHPRLLVR